MAATPGKKASKKPTVSDEGETAVALHMVRDPGNLGTIIRTADAVGAKAVIMVDECCDPFSVEAVRATMGSLFAMPIAAADKIGIVARP